MRRIALILTVIAASFAAPDAEAQIFGRRGGGASTMSLPAGCSNATCADVAKAMATTRQVGHFGNPTGGYEGCSMVMASADTPEARELAKRSTCYADSGKRQKDIGWFFDGSRMWCCRRFHSQSVSKWAGSAPASS
jgi:hypothetical protein